MLQSRRVAAYHSTLIATVVLDRIGRWVTPSRSPCVRALVASVGIFTSTLLTLVGVTLVEGAPLAPILGATITASLTYALAMLLMPVMLGETVKEFRRTVDGAGVPEKGLGVLYDWADRSSSLRRQGAFVALCVSVSVVIVAAMDRGGVAPFPIHASTYLAMAFAGAFIGQGAYWAVVAPNAALSALQLTPSEVGCFRLDPSQTPFLLAASRVSTRYALGAGVVVALCSTTLVLLRTNVESSSSWPLLGFLAFGYVATVAVFSVPQLVLAAMIVRSKNETLAGLHGAANRLLSRNDGPGSEEWSEWEELKTIHGLIRDVASTPSSYVNVRWLKSLGATLLLQTAPIAAEAFDWSSVLGAAV